MRGPGGVHAGAHDPPPRHGSAPGSDLAPRRRSRPTARPTASTTSCSRATPLPLTGRGRRAGRADRDQVARRVRRASSVASGDPLVEVGCLVADRRGVAVAGVHDVARRQRSSRRVRIDSMIVGKSEPERPVAPGPPLEQRVAAEHVAVGHEQADAAGRVARACAAPAASWPATAQFVAVDAAGRRARGRGRSRPTACRSAAWMQDRRAARASREIGGRVDVVVVPVRAARSPTTRRSPTASTIGAGVVRGVDDEHLVVVADEPDVVLDLAVLAVEREDAVGADAARSRGIVRARRRSGAPRRAPSCGTPPRPRRARSSRRRSGRGRSGPAGTGR